jgi:hypothetical protein
MRDFREGWQSFKEGLDKKHILKYWVAVWDHAWEIWWGAGVIGLICTVLTLYYAPSRWILGWVVAWVFLVAGYFAWRAYHVLLIPKLELGDVCVVPTSTTNQATGAPGPDRIVVQIPVRCATESPVSHCTGHLLRVSKWSGTEWTPTEADEPLDLLWSVIDRPIRSLEPGIDRRLCVFHVDNLPGRYIRPWVDRMIHRMAPMFDSITPADILRFDIAVKGEDCPTINISLKV